MPAGGHRKSIAFFITLGSCLVGLAVTLNIGWILINWQTGIFLVLGVLFFILIITGVVLNTVFLVREVRRNEQQDRFINAVTHELKTPLASMRLYLETLQTRQIADEKRQEFYGVMLADNQRLLRTIDQVLHAGRIGSAQQHASRAPLDLREMIQECMTAARSHHHLPAESLDYKESIAAGGQVTVVGDLEQLKTAVSNLIDNAVKYSGPQVRVLVEVAATDARHVAIRVRDQGVGIPGPELKRIFKRFYRIQGTVARRVNGTGLGLFIVRSIAKSHGGNVFAESDGAGQGSTITLELPATLEIPAPLQVPVSSRS
jgi:two-component system, OmpR family, sensor histidine kinase SenX3